MQGQTSIEEEYCNAESFHITVASAYGLKFLYGAVHPFCLAVVASHAKGIDDTLLMTVKHFNDLGNLWNPGIQCTLSPHHIKRECLSPVQLAPDDITDQRTVP